MTCGDGDTVTGQTTVLLDDDATALVFDGLFTAEERNVTPEDPDQITFDALTA